MGLLAVGPLAPWQFEKEVPPQGELDSVALLRAVGARNKAVSEAAATDPSEPMGAAREERQRDEVAGWCRVGSPLPRVAPAGSLRAVRMADYDDEQMRPQAGVLLSEEGEGITARGLAPTVEDGKVLWRDSPLVRAAKLGRVAALRPPVSL